MSVRIVDVCEITKPISSPIRNAYIDFTKMTTSLVAVVTDAVRGGKRVVGYGFNSNGRYGQGGLIRERFFTPRLRVKSYEELNAWLLDKCVAFPKAHKHPELPDKTIWQVFEEERPKLIPVPGRFDGFHATQASVSKTCLVRFDTNKYSVPSRAVGRPVEVHAYADRIAIRQDGAVIAEHRRLFGRGQTVYDPWRRAESAH